MSLAPVVTLLRCPLCASEFELGTALRCARGHSFDIARQGYVSLLSGGAKPGVNADSASMVQARQRFQVSGAYRPLIDAITAQVDDLPEGPALDVGAGTGYYLDAVLDGRLGVALDVSKEAAKLAAKLNPRIGAVVADLRHGLPVADRSFSLLLNVFAPRDGAEFRRALRPDGALIVVTPGAAHLGELVAELPMIGVDERKLQRLDDTMANGFDLSARDELEYALPLTPQQVRDVVLMGPSAHHISAQSLAELQEQTVTASFVVSVYRPTV